MDRFDKAIATISLAASAAMVVGILIVTWIYWFG